MPYGAQITTKEIEKLLKRTTMVERNHFKNNMRSLNIEENLEYWTRICRLHSEYSLFLLEFIEHLQNQQNVPHNTLHHSHILQALLLCTPSNQNFPCRLELLDAAEARLKSWKLENEQCFKSRKLR